MPLKHLQMGVYTHLIFNSEKKIRDYFKAASADQLDQINELDSSGTSKITG